MTDPQIDILAREYVKDVYGGDTDFIDEAEQVLTWLSQRYCIVEKSKLSKDGLDLAWRAKEYGTVILSSDNVYSLFPSIAKEMEE